MRRPHGDPRPTNFWLETTGNVKVLLEPTVDGVPQARLDRCLELFEDFCVVTQSVREGFDVSVEVNPLGTTSGAEAEDPALTPS